ncbi:tetratricopeptide (TPR) repeat protein [Dysgonomonadaceae bacterium PH5-43]|nr:tetratricopeptide (TPR) repeat protein [Dysgonomonadaceae bacterium PH5-43]
MKIFKTLIFVLLTSVLVPVTAQVNTNRVIAIGKNALYFEDYVLSIQYFNQVIKSKPYLAEPYLYRAMAKFYLDDYSGAENDLTVCLGINPFYVYAYQYRGAARQSLKNYQGAIEDYDKGLESRPEDKYMLLNKAIAYAQMEDYDNALQTIKTLINYHSKYMQAYFTRGMINVEKGDTVAALKDYDTALELDKYYAPLYAQRGLLYLHSEKYEESLRDFDQAIYYETNKAGYHINRGLARFYNNDLRGAMSDYDIVVDLEPNNLIARFNRGLLRSQVGDVYGALDDFNKIVELEPDNFQAIYNRAFLNQETNNNTDAIKDLNVIIEEYPNFVPAYYFRSEVKRKLNDIKGADKDYWFAYDLEQDLRKQREQGKIVTGKEVLDINEYEASEEDKVRESSDKNIAKFKKLVIYDKEEEIKSKYDSEIRGRVQDKQVKVDLEPQFLITYYEKVDEINKYTSNKDKTISEFNNKKVLPLQLKVVNREEPLTDTQVAYHFQSIDNHSLAIDRNPLDANSVFGRAIDFMLVHDLSEAINDLNRAISLNPEFELAYFNRAAVRYKQLEINNYDGNITGGSVYFETTNKKSTSKFNEDIKQSKDDKVVYELNLIINDYNIVLKLNPEFIYAYFNRGNIKFIQKDYISALEDYNKAITINPDFAECYFNRGLLYLSMGNIDKGIKDLSKAGELGLASAYSIIKKMTNN